VPVRPLAVQPPNSEVNTNKGEKTKVLFVCLGNICRSPTAEAVFKQVTSDAGVRERFEIDSCGTGGGYAAWYRTDPPQAYHEGEDADPRMTKAANARGITLNSESRPLTKQDLIDQDYIIVMDESNMREVKRAADFWGDEYLQRAKSKLKMMMDFSRDASMKGSAVPDPYYGGSKGFEVVLDLLEDACEGLLDDIRTANS